MVKNLQHKSKPVDVAYLQHKSVSKGEGSNFLENNLVRKHIFAKDYQENTTVCLLQSKILNRNDLCINNINIIFIRFIAINIT